MLQVLVIDHGPSVVKSVSWFRDALSAIEFPGVVNPTVWAVAIFTLIGALVETGTKIFTAWVSAFIETLLSPVVEHSVVNKLGLDLRHDVAVLVHQIIVLCKHAVRLDNGDL